VTDAAFTGIVRKLREEKLPRETGGVLLGCWDFLRKRLYVVHTIPSPPDSKERQCLYIRGVAGLAQAVNEAETRTGRMLQYIGEWHSHPDGFAATPSKDDLNVWGWIAEKTTEDGYPPVMLIVGEHDLSWFVGVIAKYAAEMRSEEERLQRTP
jgi:integrative and conjugative element protein (TIGR02256 family)